MASGNTAHREAGLTIFGMPFGEFLLKAGAIGAGLLALRQTVLGMHILLGSSESYTSWPFAFLAALIVQGGLVAVSIYVARRFVQARQSRRGAPGSGVDRSISWLTAVILAILMPISVMFTFSGFQSQRTAKQEHDDRVRVTAETATLVQQTIRRTAEDEMRRVTRLVRASDAFKSWEAGISRLVDLGSQPDVPALTERFIEDNRRAHELYEIAKKKRAADIANAIVPLQAELGALEASRKRLIEEQKTFITGERLQALQELVDAEEAGQVIERLGIRTTGRPGCSTQCQARKQELATERARIAANKQALDRINRDIERLQNQKVELESGRLPTAQPAAQAPAQPGRGNNRRGPQTAQPQPAPSAPAGEPIEPPANAALIGKLVADKGYVTKLTASLQGQANQLADIYRETVYLEASKGCTELKDYLTQIYPAQRTELGAVTCEVANPGAEVGNLNAFAQVFAASGAVCDKVPEPPGILGLPLDQKRTKSLEYVEQVKAFAQNCQAAAGLAQRGETTKAGRDRVAAQVKQLEDSYGEGAIYLTRVLGQLVKQEPQALQSFGLALAIDSLILVLAFLSELPSVRLDTGGVRPLNETERRKLLALIKHAQDTDDPRFRTERLLVDTLKSSPKGDGYVLELGHGLTPEDARRLRGLVLPLQDAETGLAWSLAKDGSRMAVTPRGYYELLKGMDDVLKAQGLEGGGAHDGEPDLIARPGPGATPARGDSFDYRGLFDRKSATARPVTGAPAAAEEDLGYLQGGPRTQRVHDDQHPGEPGDPPAGETEEMRRFREFAAGNPGRGRPRR